MKKVIFLMSVIGVTFLMTSCLGDSETSFSGAPLSYIKTMNSGLTTYALTLEGGYPITSPQIALEEPGTFVFIAYSWSESLNTITSDEIYNATVTQISDPIEQTSLFTVDAPELTETETPLTNFGSYAWWDYVLDNKWVLVYSYKKGDGNEKVLRFYHNLEEGSENEIVIDVRVVEGLGTITADQSNIPIALNMTALCNYYSGKLSSSGDTETLRVCFQYPTEKSDGTIELTKTQLYSMPFTKQ